MALVVYRIFLTSSGYAKRGMTCSQVRCQIRPMGGYFLPQAPASNSATLFSFWCGDPFSCAGGA